MHPCPATGLCSCCCSILAALPVGCEHGRAVLGQHCIQSCRMHAVLGGCTPRAPSWLAAAPGGPLPRRPCAAGTAWPPPLPGALARLRASRWQPRKPPCARRLRAVTPGVRSVCSGPGRRARAASHLLCPGPGTATKARPGRQREAWRHLWRTGTAPSQRALALRLPGRLQAPRWPELLQASGGLGPCHRPLACVCGPARGSAPHCSGRALLHTKVCSPAAGTPGGWPPRVCWASRRCCGSAAALEGAMI